MSLLLLVELVLVLVELVLDLVVVFVLVSGWFVFAALLVVVSRFVALLAVARSLDRTCLS